MRRWLPKRRMLSLHQLRCVDGGEMAGRAVLEEHEPSVSASVQLAEQREVELGLDRCGWFGLACGGGRRRLTCGGGGPRLACGSSGFWGPASCSSFNAVARRRLGIEIGLFVNDYANSTVTTPRREIIIARIGHRSILRLRNRCLIEQVRTPARGFELVGFSKAGKPIAERKILAPVVKMCLPLHHDQTWSLTPS